MLIFLVGSLLGVLMGGALCVRYLRREVAADIGPKLKHMQLQLDNIETELNLAIMTRHAELATCSPGAPTPAASIRTTGKAHGARQWPGRYGGASLPYRGQYREYRSDSPNQPGTHRARRPGKGAGTVRRRRTGSQGRGPSSGASGNRSFYNTESTPRGSQPAAKHALGDAVLARDTRQRAAVLKVSPQQLPSGEGAAGQRLLVEVAAAAATGARPTMERPAAFQRWRARCLRLGEVNAVD